MKISIAMPYWNRPRELKNSLQAYDRVYPDLDLEYVVCDDGSADKPLPHPRMKVITLPRKMDALNPCVPINRAVRGCSSSIIVLTNPEIEHRERVLDKMLADLWEPNEYVMTGCRNTADGAWYSGPERSMEGTLAPPKGYFHFCVMFMRSLFERAGGFDEEYREGHGYDDNDWLFRLHALGDVDFKYVPGTVWHVKSPLQRSIWKWPLLQRNEALITKKWGHLPEFRRCE